MKGFYQQGFDFALNANSAEEIVRNPHTIAEAAEKWVDGFLDGWTHRTEKLALKMYNRMVDEDLTRSIISEPRRRYGQNFLIV